MFGMKLQVITDIELFVSLFWPYLTGVYLIFFYRFWDPGIPPTYTRAGPPIRSRPKSKDWRLVRELRVREPPSARY